MSELRIALVGITLLTSFGMYLGGACLFISLCICVSWDPEVLYEHFLLAISAEVGEVRAIDLKAIFGQFASLRGWCTYCSLSLG